MKKIFPWKRFWCPSEGKIQLDDSGYLFDPEEEYAKYYDLNVVSFAEIENVPCLILLGEPGIGKTQAVTEEVRRFETNCQTDKVNVLTIELKEYGSEDRLERAICESREWKDIEKGKKLYLFLDGLDEVKIRISHVSSLLLSIFKKASIDKLFVRVTCRTDDWPWSFSDNLKDLYKENNVKVYEMAPLRECDVHKAAQITGIDAEKFMKAIEDKQAAPLAGKPITLTFLLNLYKIDRQFPPTSHKLYEKGCLNLCEEPNRERRERGDNDKRYIGFLSSEQRLAISSRIAAAMILSNSYAVFKDIDSGNIPDGCISIKNLMGGKENVLSKYFDISEDSVKETLKTGLFSGRGENLMGFAHQSYAEYLTSRYLLSAHINQIKSLFLHPTFNHKIIPQLRETLSWLASQREDVFSWVLSIEPTVLLNPDSAVLSNNDKEKLVDSFLKKIKNEEIIDGRDFRKHYKNLNHPNLSDQIKPIIGNKKASFILRRTAFDIAEACRLKKLQNLLGEIALDKNEEYESRVSAAYIISEIADKNIKKTLEPLASEKSGNDPEDQLKAYGIMCVWPDYWSILDVLKNLTPPKKKSFYGAYQRLLSSEIPNQIPNDDFSKCMPEALEIIKEWPIEDYRRNPFKCISDQIILIAWSLMPGNKIEKILCEIILKRLRNHHSIFNDIEGKPIKDIFKNPLKRRSVVKCIINELIEKESNCWRLVHNDTPLIMEEDFLWLLEQIEKCPNNKQKLWVQCVWFVFRWDLPRDLMNEFLKIHSRVPVLAERIPTYLELNDKTSRYLKADYLRRKRSKIKKKSKFDSSVIENRIDDALLKLKSGDINSWYDLTYFLSTDKDGITLHFPSNIKDTYFWKVAGDLKQEQVCNAAKQFLLNYIPTDDSWFGKGSYSWKVESAYLAIRLIADDCGITDSIPNHIWERWVPYMLDAPTCNDNESACFVFKLAYQKAPEATKSYFKQYIDIENSKGHIFFIDKLEKCWIEDFNSLILQKILDKKLKPECFFHLASFLFDQKFNDIKEIVAKNITNPYGENEEREKVRVKAIVLAFTYMTENHWPVLWSILNSDTEIVEPVFCELANNRHNMNFTKGLNENKIADLYSFMCQKFPPEEDPEIDGAHSVGSREMIGDLRNNLINILVSRGTIEACDALKLLVDKFPERRISILWRLEEAEEKALKKKWISPKAEFIINLLQDKDRRLVENDEQLLAAVIESLKRMQEYYQGSLLPCKRLWNEYKDENKRTTVKPKDEESLSDEIVLWLRDDLGQQKGIITNREVQPRRGQKTDVYINAVSQNQRTEACRVLTVVMEVKGNWNDKICSAMEEQLVNKYMSKNNISKGIFLLGWYSSEKWDDRDHRKQRVNKLILNDLSVTLENQAKSVNKKHPPNRRVEPFVLDLSI